MAFSFRARFFGASPIVLMLLACAPMRAAAQDTLPPDQEPERTLEGHRDGILSVAYSPDGRLLASASRDGTIKIWNVETGDEQTTLEGHSGQVLRLAFGSNNLLASAGADKTVRLWDIAAGESIATLTGH